LKVTSSRPRSAELRISARELKDVKAESQSKIDEILLGISARELKGYPRTVMVARSVV
jgi:hypothetical protein